MQVCDNFAIFTLLLFLIELSVLTLHNLKTMQRGMCTHSGSKEWNKTSLIRVIGVKQGFIDMMTKTLFTLGFLITLHVSVKAQFYISEVSPANGSVKDMFANSSDWFEISSDNKPTDLHNWRISDKAKFENAHILPDTSLNPHQSLLVFASGNSSTAYKVHEVIGDGSWIGRWSTWERNTFNYTKLKGDFSVTVKVNSIHHDSVPTEAVLMIRENLSENSRYIGISVMNNGACVRHIKPSENPNADRLFFRLEACPIDMKLPDAYLKMEKIGDSVRLSLSKDGYYWSNSDMIHFPFGNQDVFAGLAIAPTNYLMSKNIRLTYSGLSINNQPMENGFPLITGIKLENKPKKNICRELHAPFQLSASGEKLYLWNPEGELIDTISWGKVPGNITYGKDSYGNSGILQYPTPGNNSAEIVSGICERTTVNKSSGFYTLPISVHALNTHIGDTIRYTLNGEIPDLSSHILSNHSQLYIDKNTTLRLITYRGHFKPSNVQTYTYIFDEKKEYPTLFLTSAERNWWSDTLGILYDSAEKSNSYAGFEIPVSVEYVKNNTRMFFENGGCSLRGSYSRTLPQKPFDIDFRSRYGASALQYNLFGKSNDEYEKFIVRNGGQDWWSISFRDNVSAVLARYSGLDYQEFSPARVYINGNYWGHYMLQESSSDEYVAENFSVDKEHISMVGMAGNPLYGSSRSFHAWRDKLSQSDCTIDSVFGQCSAAINMEQFYIYTALQVFIGNRDFPGNNVKLWQDTTDNSPWRFILYDTDLAHASTWGFDADIFHQILSPQKTNWANDTISTILWRKFFSNKNCKNTFLTRLADELNTHFSERSYVSIIDSLNAIVKDEMSDHRKRWQMITTDWDKEIERIKDFGKHRPAIVRNQAIHTFKLKGITHITAKSYPENKGNIVTVSRSISTDNSNSGLFFQEMPIKLNAKENKGWKFLRWMKADSVLSSTKEIMYSPIDETESIIAEFVIDSSAITNEQSIVINEIMYKPHDDKDCKDWIEVTNYGNASVDIGKWILKDDDDDHEYVFPENTVINQYEHYVICEDTTLFLQFYSRPQFILGNIDFGFGRGDQVRLFDAQSILVDSVKYGVTTPWDADADGTGQSLELKSPESDNTIATNWYANGEQNGTPGRANTPTLNVHNDELTGFSVEYNNSSIIIRQLREAQISDIAIYDIRGNTMHSSHNADKTEIRISLDDFPTGLFMISVNDNMIKSRFYKSFIHFR